MVVHEAAQSGPTAGQTTDLQVGGVLDTVYTDGDVDLVGLCIAGGGGCLVGGGGEDASGVGLEVPAATQFERQRPATDIGACRRVESDRRAPLRRGG